MSRLSRFPTQLLLQAQATALQTLQEDPSDLPSRRRVGIDAALDLGDALLMAEDQLGHGNRSANQDRRDRYQEDSQAENAIDYPVHSPHPQGLKPVSFLGPLAARLKVAPFPVLSFHNSVKLSRHPPSFLVELTGIEPVASWLQTRRSPS